MNENAFMEEYNAIFERALLFSLLSRSMGLASLNNSLNKEKYNERDIFEYGMRLVMDGRTPELIDKIVTNIINLETDTERKILKTIQKDAVLSIQQNVSPEELAWIMNSYVPIKLDKAMEKYNEINEYISKEITNEYDKFKDNLAEIYTGISEKIVNALNKTGKKA
jgi:predicted Zn-dependent peptidase